ncbi:MAG: CRISPR-associated endonuclease Cas2 [Methanomicrobiales archaeon HGW-Methanomicrobiales-5]|jgi:CRISPR-associated protein Cas2|nr:MAG: CRISPR-associated endonuclease Cas2 [Methanomicrobiales archaeon HGW-Methanomicrobiales-5]
MNSKFVFVAYDIQENSIRNRLIDVLFYYGLERVQLSIFCGFVVEKRFDSMVEQIKSEFGNDEDKILIVNLCKGCLKNIVSINFDVPEEAWKHLVL